MKTTADRIRERRTELGMTQEELAKKMRLSDRSSITRIEKSGNKVSLKMIQRISPCLDCTPAYLLGVTNDPHYNPDPRSLNLQETLTLNRVHEMYDLEDEDEDDPETTEKKPKIQGKGKTYVAFPSNASGKVEVTTISSVGSGRNIDPVKVTGVQVLPRNPEQRHRVAQKIAQPAQQNLTEREELIKKILTLPDKLISEVSNFIDYQISKLEGGE